MKVLVLCGVFAEENQQEILQAARRPVEYSANIFQEKLIRGLCSEHEDVEVLSAPFIGSYPNASSIRVFRRFAEPQTAYRYVPFHNLWGVRNISRARSLKKAIKAFADAEDARKLIVIYSPHTPFLEAAVYAKKRDPRIRICLVVPDLPQYMNLDDSVSRIYKIAKSFDIATLNRLNRAVDSYMLLTEPMKEKLDVRDCPYIVAEGLIAEDIETAVDAGTADDDGLRYVVYTGKMSERFGVKALVDAFMMLPDESYRLVLCGNGDARAYIEEKSAQDARILYRGQVTPQEAKQWMRKAAVLVNPRKNNEVYTRYSFPSKNVEYLSAGAPVVAYELDGIPSAYREFLYYVPDDSDEALMKTIQQAALTDRETQNARHLAAMDYFKHHLSASRVARRILDMNFKEQ